MTEKTPVWTLDQALTLIRDIQPGLKPLGYHVALAGGTLNAGRSFKDLDLVFIPLTNDEAPSVDALRDHLSALWGEWDSSSEFLPSHQPNPYTPFRDQLTTNPGGKRIDIFII